MSNGLLELNLRSPSIAPSLARSLARSSLAPSLDRSVARSLGHSVARSLGRSFVRSLSRSVARSLGRSVARSLARSLELANYFGGSIFRLQICWAIIYEVRCSIQIVEELGSNCFIVLGSIQGGPAREYHVACCTYMSRPR